MKIPKKVKDIPWGEEFRSEGTQQLRIDLHWPVADGERLLVADFRRNVKLSHVWGSKKGPDFRLVCSKKTGRATVLYQGGKAGQRHDLHRAMCSWLGTPVSCYPEITPEDEKALGRWLGKKSTSNHMMPELSLWVKTAIETEAKAERTAKGEFENGDWTLCPDEIPDGLVDYIRREVLPHDKTLVYSKGNVSGVCFCCGRAVRAKRDRFIQNASVLCPNCGERVYCYLDTGVRYETQYVGEVVSIQRGTDGQSVWLRQWHLRRDFSAQWRDIPAQLDEVVRYGIRGDRVAKWQCEVKESWYAQSYRHRLDDWRRVRSLTVIYEGGYWMHVPAEFKALVAGTSLQYCDLPGYMSHEVVHSRNPIRFLLDWVRYPAVEKLWKAGYTQLVDDHIWGVGEHLRSAIRLSGARIEDALKFPLRLLRLKAPEEWSTEDVARMGGLWKLVQDGKLREPEAVELFRAAVDYRSLANAWGHAPCRRILRYLEDAQKTLEGRGVQYKRMGAVVQTYRDYLEDCVRLKLDLDDRQVLFPANLYAAHQRTICQVKYQADKAMRERFSAAADKLAELAWVQNGLMIRPAASAEELSMEGAALHHCVGGYADRMSRGETAILLIRKSTQPDKPYYTLEYRDGSVIQCRTAHNGSYLTDKTVKPFVDAWLAHIQKKSKKKTAGSAA